MGRDNVTAEIETPAGSYTVRFFWGSAFERINPEVRYHDDTNADVDAVQAIDDYAGDRGWEVEWHNMRREGTTCVAPLARVPWDDDDRPAW